ncbi:MAG: hypothetical protein LBL27_01355, partial [Coriobacteriales bacterium]|nr:hypothetical protein [Coriobacteriales bacterium]
MTMNDNPPNTSDGPLDTNTSPRASESKKPAAVPDAFNRLIERAETYLGADDIVCLKKAYTFANRAHEGQIRKTGE